MSPTAFGFATIVQFDAYLLGSLIVGWMLRRMDNEN